MNCELVCIRIPRRTPPFRNDGLAAHFDCRISGIIKNKLIITSLSSLKRALICDIRIEEHEILRKVHHLLHLRLDEILEIELRFVTDYGLAVFRDICTCETAFLALRVIELEHISQLLVIGRISETHHRIAVHQDAISLVGNDERYGYLSIVLEEFLVLSLIVKLICLMLSEAVERLIIRRLEHLPERIPLGSFHFYRLESLSATGLLRQDRIAFNISEPHFSGGHVHTCND